MIECCVSLLKSKEIMNNSDRATIIDSLMNCFGVLYSICFHKSSEEQEEKEEDNQEFPTNFTETFPYENLKIFMEILLENDSAFLPSSKWYGEVLSSYFVPFLLRLFRTIPASSGCCGQEDAANHPLFKYDLIPLFFKLLAKNEYLIVVCCFINRESLLYRVGSELRRLFTEISNKLRQKHSGEMMMVSFGRVPCSVASSLMFRLCVLH